MTPEKLLSLVYSWRTSDCPAEVLLDACIDIGIDVDNKHTFGIGETIRWHLTSPICNLSESRRFCFAAVCLIEWCNDHTAADLIRKQLETAP